MGTSACVTVVTSTVGGPAAGVECFALHPVRQKISAAQKWRLEWRAVLSLRGISDFMSLPYVASPTISCIAVVPFARISSGRPRASIIYSSSHHCALGHVNLHYHFGSLFS